jgi:hypothetical protein
MGAAASHWGLIREGPRRNGHEGQTTTSCSISVLAPRHPRKDPLSARQCTRRDRRSFHVKPETTSVARDSSPSGSGEREGSECNSRIPVALESGMCAAARIGEPNATAAGNPLVAAHLRSRSRLRAHLVEELPGWQYWLDYTAQLVREAAHDRTVLLSDRELLKNLEHFVLEWVQALGEEGEVLFRPVMQLFSGSLKSGREYPAAGPFNQASEPPAVAWEDLKRLFDRQSAWPSPMLIQFLGAYAMSVLERRRGAKGDPRRAIAVEHVVEHLGPFMAGQPRAGASVYPKVYGDPGVEPEMARKKPVTCELAAEVAIFLAAPGEEDVEYDGPRGGPRRSSDELDTAPTAVRQYVELIRTRLALASSK